MKKFKFYVLEMEIEAVFLEGNVCKERWVGRVCWVNHKLNDWIVIILMHLNARVPYENAIEKRLKRT